MLHNPHNDHERLLQAFCESRQLGKTLHALSGMQWPHSSHVYLSLLKTCIKKKALVQAKQIYAHLSRHRVQLNSLLAGYLVVTLAKCGAIEDALQLSQSLPRRSVFSWTALISACVDFGWGSQALELHQCMLEDGVEANAFTYASLFKACGSVSDLARGKKFHDDARKRGFMSHAFVANTIVSMYGKCGALADAEDVFSALPQQDAVSWNAMLSA
eukprot:c2004_g1_i1 orf=1-642(-)